MAVSRCSKLSDTFALLVRVVVVSARALSDGSTDDGAVVARLGFA